MPFQLLNSHNFVRQKFGDLEETGESEWKGVIKREAPTNACTKHCVDKELLK